MRKRARAHQIGERKSTERERYNYFREMWSGFEVGSYLRLIDFVYHSNLGLREIKKKKKGTTHCLLASEAILLNGSKGRP